jgi:Mg-chelatase subunit ChlD
MKNKQTIYHFVVDKSGSMSGMEAQTIDGFNKQLSALQALKKEFPEQDYRVSLTLFNGEVSDVVLFGNVETLAPLDATSYRPEGSTSLLDAIGKSIYKIKQQFGNAVQNDEASVVMVILTDGEENSSRMYTYKDIAEMISTLDATGKWNFSFLGADLDAIRTSEQLNIRRENVISFDKRQYDHMMADVTTSMRSYEEAKRSGFMKNDLFDIFKDKDRRNKDQNS